MNLIRRPGRQIKTITIGVNKVMGSMKYSLREAMGMKTAMDQVR